MEDSQIIATANAILAQLTVPRRVETIQDLNADLFVTLYEGLCGDSIPDLILPTSKEEDEVHNMQCVIDSLAMDILHTSLAHIVGQDVVNGRRMSLINLLDIFSGLLEYILDGIEKEEISSSAEGREGSENTDTINQSAISDALRKGLKDTTNQQQSHRAEATDIGGSPTASPSSKKLRRSEERRKGKKATPNAVSQPIASSSMRSINPSCTESESDVSTKPTAGRALSFSKVPAEFSPKATSPSARADDATFIKPSVPSEQTIAQKLAEEILATGESTNELIALGDTPVRRPRTRSATRKQAAEARRKTLHAEKLSENDTNGERQEEFGAGKKAKGTKRSRHPKRHVSFVSDRTLPSDDTLADVPTQLEYPRRVASDPTHVRVGSPSSAPEDLDISARLADYFEGKETRQSRAAGRNSSAKDGAGDRSPIPQSSEYHTAMEKSASLYERVKALRNAANEKLESLRSDSISEDYRTAGAGDLSTTEYYMPTSGGVRQTTRGSSGDSVSQTTSKYLTAHADSSNAPAPSRAFTGNLPRGNGVGTENCLPRLQTNAPDIATLVSSTAGDAISSAEKYTSTSSQQPNSQPYYTTTQASRSMADLTGRDAKTDTYLTGCDAMTDTYLKGRDAKTDTYLTGQEPKTDTYHTGHDPDSDTYHTSQDPKLRIERLTSESIKKPSYGDEDYERIASGLSKTRSGRPGKDISWPGNIPMDELGEEEESGASSLRFTVDRHRDTASKSVLDSYSRPSWRVKHLPESKHKKVRFTRSSAASNQKSKSQTMVDAVKKTLDEEKWRERMQEKLLTRQYREDLSDMVEAHRNQIEEEKAAASQQDKQFTSNMQRLAQAYDDKPPPRAKPSGNAKGYLLPKSRVVKKKPLRKSASKTVDSKPVKSLDPDDEDFLPNLMEEFPHLYLAPETIQKMWTNHQKQSASISKSMEEEKRKKSKAKATIEDAERRQALLMNIMQKELDHTKRMKQLRDKENSEIESKRKQRDVRVQSARVRQYYDEYATRMKASMLRNKTKEEQLFKRLFAEGLKVQKERMQTLRSYAREQRERRAHKQAVDVESLENFYKDQFAMLAESVAQERKNVEVRDSAQAQVLNNMKAELRKKMEADIKNFQEQLKCDDDDYYFRQLDAEKAVQKLNMARFQTGL